MNPAYPQKPAADQGVVRRINTALVLDLLRRHAPLSRAELAARSGLNRSTVSLIINDLIEEGYVQETELKNPRIGRPGMQLTLNPAAGCAVGVDIGVDFLSVILTDFSANVLWRKRADSNPTEDQTRILERAMTMTAEAIDAGLGQGLRPLGIGLGAPGLVDLHQGKLIFAPNLRWFNLPLRLIWSQRFALPVFIENEANAAALGEYSFGVARGVDNFIYLSAGIGLGGGVMIDGKLFRGSQGYAGEIGHMTVEPEGELCGCGRRGCWETIVGPRAVLRRVRQTLAAGAPSTLADLIGGDLDRLSMEHIVQAARRGDQVALSALKDVGKSLGMGIINLIHIFNPELIVLGGALSLAAEFLLEEIETIVRENALKPPGEHVRFAASAHGADACVMGAAALVLDEILREPAFSPRLTIGGLT
jgi:glucokinase-like ROK family protein